MPYETIPRLEGAVRIGDLADKINDIIGYINERRDIPARALAVEGLAARQAQTIVRWWRDSGFTKKDIKNILDL